ncbi:hypothetical protein H310_12839 [Aphanomyces invadans]|uniref:Uncharacterized protein n=1 Tax=Aphanomyces invadans TaxID=157072 RepID=A0A024THE1_9STRA|nr:hypothetical protein H310_12839 [Aphanomyces invadans]ETV93001.1 hypothetical protein H310_12839 [Aphanomyces invadans]|eukprot:XP_008878266.1 hypothetical protein H310_12839 [Aphanomyces invadans]
MAVYHAGAARCLPRFLVVTWARDIAWKGPPAWLRCRPRPAIDKRRVVRAPPAFCVVVSPFPLGGIIGPDTREFCRWSDEGFALDVGALGGGGPLAAFGASDSLLDDSSLLSSFRLSVKLESGVCFNCRSNRFCRRASASATCRATSFRRASSCTKAALLSTAAPRSSSDRIAASFSTSASNSRRCSSNLRRSASIFARLSLASCNLTASSRSRSFSIRSHSFAIHIASSACRLASRSAIACNSGALSAFNLASASTCSRFSSARALRISCRWACVRSRSASSFAVDAGFSSSSDESLEWSTPPWLFALAAL